jgi:hypothetical protein
MRKRENAERRRGRSGAERNALTKAFQLKGLDGLKV